MFKNPISPSAVRDLFKLGRTQFSTEKTGSHELLFLIFPITFRPGKRASTPTHISSCCRYLCVSAHCAAVKDAHVHFVIPVDCHIIQRNVSVGVSLFPHQDGHTDTHFQHPVHLTVSPSHACPSVFTLSLSHNLCSPTVFLLSSSSMVSALVAVLLTDSSWMSWLG